MTRATVLLGCSILLFACGGGENAETSTPATSAEQSAMPEDVRVAANVARAIDAAPGKADSILAANNLTVERLDSLMYAIASDSAKTAAYEAARQ